MDLTTYPHVWKHTITSRYGDPSFVIEVVSHKATIYDIVEDFSCYLKGCGFTESLILDGFLGYTEEHAHEAKNADKPSLSD